MLRSTTSLLVTLLSFGCAATGDATRSNDATTPATQAPTIGAPASRAPIDGHRRLAHDVIPTRYELDLTVDPRRDRFFGKAAIEVKVAHRTPEIRLHADGPKVTRVQIQVAGKTLAARSETGRNGGLAILVAEPLPLGDATIHIDFEAPLPTTPLGIYRVESGDDWYVFTQFEPLEARRAFPSFDQPEFKTPFKTTMRVPRGMTALTNGPEDKQSASGDFVRFDFAQTKPIPTYLVAFAVGPFDIVEAPPTPGLPRIRTVAVKGKGKLATWANATTAKVLTALQDYFGEPYPYAKLDQVAVPNFSSGAMENVGLVTYRERLLLLGDGSDAPPEAKMWGTVVIAHELGHMWFGNKVTLAWWDDLWLNEAFATWISFKITDLVAPELDASVAMRGRVGRTMSWDAQAASRAIRQPIEHGGDVYNAFDPITYSKGAAVLNMVEAWLGPEDMRKGIRGYVAAHSHGVATTPDLLEALKKASGKDVSRAIAMFLDQPGTPLVKASLRCSKGSDARPRLELSQTRYLPAGSTTAQGAPWRIPMCVRFGHRDGRTQRHCGELTGPSGELRLPVRWCPAWFHPNDGEQGYYRWSLDTRAMKALVTTYRSRLTIVERVALADHFQALVEANAIDTATVLEGLLALSTETHHEIVKSLISPLKTFHRHVPKALRGEYGRKVVRKALGPHLKRLGFVTAPNPKSNSFADALIRPAVSRAYVDLMGAAASTQAKAAVRAAKAALAELAKADAKLFSVAVPMAGRHGGSAFRTTLRRSLDKAPTPAHRVAMVRGLGAAADAAGVKAGLDLLLDGTLRAQDVREVRRFSSSSYAAVRAGWDWLTTNYEAMVKLVGTKSARHLVWFGASLCTEEDKAAFTAFFSAPARATLGTKRMAAAAGEMIDRCVRMRATVQPALTRYLTDSSCKAPKRKCRRGYRCDEETDTCVKVIREPKSCRDVTCAVGERCRLGRCVTRKAPGNPPTGKGAGLGAISITVILRVTPVGSKKSRLVLSRGSVHHVSVGDIVHVPGVGKGTINKVHPRRSQAIMNKPPSALAGKKHASVRRWFR